MADEFVLDPRLEADTWAVADWYLARVRLMDHRDYPWFILIPRRPGLHELHHLTAADGEQLARESLTLARAMEQAFTPKTLNVAKLGNIVEQLHLHHVARFEGDLAWPGPVWGAPRSRGLGAQEVGDRIDRVLAYC